MVEMEHSDKDTDGQDDDDVQGDIDRLVDYISSLLASNQLSLPSI